MSIVRTPAHIVLVSLPILSERALPDLSHPLQPGAWTLLQQRLDHAMWQQDLTDPNGLVTSRFWIVNPPERLMYDTFDEAESLFEQLEDT